MLFLFTFQNYIYIHCLYKKAVAYNDIRMQMQLTRT